ncbi:MAG TPA: PadR family transcriptional regulator [Marmoricola sp.]|nr:PadR family transcriptional regulator [Marmoricola sp.]
MPRRTTTSYALLGLLALRSWTTYELAKQVQRSLNWFWPRAERKLYDEPKHLVAAGLATATSESTGKRPRTVYSITRAGRRELAAWLDEPAAPRSGEFEAMVKVFFADAGDLDQLRTTLGRMEEEARDRIRALAEMAAHPPQFLGRLHISALTLRLGLEQERAVLAWAEWAREQVSHWRSTTDWGDWDPQAVLDQLAE